MCPTKRHWPAPGRTTRHQPQPPAAQLLGCRPQGAPLAVPPPPRLQAPHSTTTPPPDLAVLSACVMWLYHLSALLRSWLSATCSQQCPLLPSASASSGAGCHPRCPLVGRTWPWPVPSVGGYDWDWLGPTAHWESAGKCVMQLCSSHVHSLRFIFGTEVGCRGGEPALDFENGNGTHIHGAWVGGWVWVCGGVMTWWRRFAC
jgi:hypothetical protein